MAFKLPKNLVSSNNMQNVLYLVTLALAVSYIMNRQNLALVSLLVVAAGVYMFKKNVVLALGVSIVVTNLLLSMNYFRQFEGFKEGRRNMSGSTALAALSLGNSSQGAANATNCTQNGGTWNPINQQCSVGSGGLGTVRNSGGSGGLGTVRNSGGSGGIGTGISGGGV